LIWYIINPSLFAMQRLLITREFLKTPAKSLPFLLVVVFFSSLAMIAVNLSLGQRLLKYSVVQSVAIFVIPEIVTVIVFILLINAYHLVFRIQTVQITTKGIAFYQLKVLPVFLLGYPFFFPITFSVRFFLKYFPNYILTQYLYSLKNIFSLESYFLYLTPIIVLGYILVNVSLAYDFFEQTSFLDLDIEFSDQNENDLPTNIVNNDPQYLTILKLRNNTGDTFLSVKDCYYFEASDHGALVYHQDGSSRLNTTITALNKQLDPRCFIKINPRYIINVSYLGSYTYTEQGQYALHFKIPIGAELFVAKSRLPTLKNILHN
jgi:two-component system, LytTR family, response regulator